MATTKVRLAVASYHSSTFRNPKIENAGNKVQIVVLDGSFAYKEVTYPIPEYNDGIDTMRANGQLVFGYIPCKGDEANICNVRTGGADPDVPQAREGIDNWYNLYPQIDGIYLDEGPLYEGDHISSLNSEKIQENYKDYSNYIQTKRNGRVIMEASAYPFDWILDIAEFILLWRGNVDKYENHYNGYLQRNGPPIDQTFSIPDWRYSLPN